MSEAIALEKGDGKANGRLFFFFFFPLKALLLLWGRPCPKSFSFPLHARVASLALTHALFLSLHLENLWFSASVGRLDGDPFFLNGPSHRSVRPGRGRLFGRPRGHFGGACVASFIHKKLWSFSLPFIHPERSDRPTDFEQI